jgi:hypothetical protein
MPDQEDNAPPEFLDLVSVDKTVHEPARLAILTALSACASADYVLLPTDGPRLRESESTSRAARGGRSLHR